VCVCECECECECECVGGGGPRILTLARCGSQWSRLVLDSLPKGKKSVQNRIGEACVYLSRGSAIDMSNRPVGLSDNCP
jgi:hypothetical protein